MPACWMQGKQEDLDPRKEDDENYRPRHLVSIEMAVNDLVCEDINAGSLDLLMPSVMKKTWRQVDTSGRGSNDAGNDEDGGQQYLASGTRRRTSSISMSDGKVLTITGTATLWIQWES